MAVPIAESAISPPVLDLSLEHLADAAPTAVEVLQAATADSTLAELGLAAHTPVGLIQNLLEYMHLDLGLPWWGAIVVGKHGAQQKRLSQHIMNLTFWGNSQGRLYQYLI